MRSPRRGPRTPWLLPRRRPPTPVPPPRVPRPLETSACSSLTARLGEEPQHRLFQHRRAIPGAGAVVIQRGALGGHGRRGLVGGGLGPRLAYKGCFRCGGADRGGGHPAQADAHLGDLRAVVRLTGDGITWRGRARCVVGRLAFVRVAVARRGAPTLVIPPGALAGHRDGPCHGCG